MGRWSGYPSYEGVPEKLLLKYPTAVLVGALTHRPVTQEQAEGAARYFGGWWFGNEKAEFHMIPAGLKQRLLEHTLEHSDPSNAHAAQRAFGGWARMATTDIKAGCYCDLWETDPKVLEDQGVPRGYCGMCGCGAPGHTRHYPGPVPVTSAWCDECYRRLPRPP